MLEDEPRSRLGAMIGSVLLVISVIAMYMAEVLYGN
jgi:hypothetical protein